MITILLIISVLVFVGLPVLFVFSACIAAARSDRRDETRQPAQAPAKSRTTVPNLAQHAAD